MHNLETDKYCYTIWDNSLNGLFNSLKESENSTFLDNILIFMDFEN